MTKDQILPAFLCALLAEGVEPMLIERAVTRVRSVRLGESYVSDPLHRAFASEQTRLLNRSS